MAVRRRGCASALRATISRGRRLRAVAEFRAAHPALHCQIHAEYSSALLRDLRRGDYDLVLAGSDSEQAESAYRRWLEPTAWGAASPTIAEAEGPLRLAVVGESSLSRRLSVAALEAGRGRLRDRVCGGQLRRADPGRLGRYRRRLLGAAAAAWRGGAGARQLAAPAEGAGRGGRRLSARGRGFSAADRACGSHRRFGRSRARV